MVQWVPAKAGAIFVAGNMIGEVEGHSRRLDKV